MNNQSQQSISSQSTSWHSMKLTFRHQHSCIIYTTSESTTTVRLKNQPSLAPYFQNFTYLSSIPRSIHTMSQQASNEKYRINGNSQTQNPRFPQRIPSRVDQDSRTYLRSILYTKQSKGGQRISVGDEGGVKPAASTGQLSASA